MASEEPPRGAGDAQQRHPDRPDVFVSYAREDEQFVSTRLVGALEARGKDVWIDRDEIPPAADWRERIGHGIEASRAFVFVLSPDSLRSQECGQELRQAITDNKRLIPLVYRDVDADGVPDELRRPNWIWLRDVDDYDAQFARLVAALETDLDWVDTHARIGVRAGEWTRGARDRGFLLRGNDLRAAEGWLSAEDLHEEGATAAHREYISASRRAATRRQLLTGAAVAVALVVSAGLGALAIVRAQQRRLAVEGRQAALAQRQLADSRQVAAEAGVLHTSRPDLSMLLGVQAFLIAPTVEARGSLLSEQAQHYAGTLAVGSSVFTMAFSPDSRTLATAGADRRVDLWDVNTHARLASIASPGSTDELAFSPDGKLLAGAGGKVTYWDARGAHRQTAVCEVRGASVRGIAFSADGKTLATADQEGTVHLLAVPTCRVIKRFKLFARFTSEVAFNPTDSKVLAAVGDHQRVKLLNVRTGARLASLSANTSPVYGTALAFNTAGTLVASGGPNHTVKIWSTRTHALLRTLRGAPNAVGDIAFSADGRTVATTSGSESMLWDVRTGHPLAALARLASQVSDVAFTADGSVLATSSISEGKIRLWKARQPVFHNAFHVLRTVHSHDGKTLAVVDTNSVTLLDARSHETKMVLATASPRGVGRGNWDIAFSPDDRLLATVGRRSAKLWDLRTGAQLDEVTNNRVDFLMSVAFSHDGRTLAIAGIPGPIVLLDAKTRRIKARWKGASGDIAGYSKLTFTNDGRHLIGVGSGVDIWDARTGEQVATVDKPGDRKASIESATVSRDGRLLAGGRGDGSIVMWDLRTRRPEPRQLDNLGGHTGAINDLAFSDDGRTLATAGEDSTVKLWDVRTARRLVATLAGHRGPVNSVSFNRDRTLASGSDDQTAISWDLDPRQVSSGICRSLRSTLGRSDWARYVPNQAYGRVCPVYRTERLRPKVGPRPTAVADLVRRLPGAAYLVAAMDLRRARRELGVSPDLDPRDYRGRQSSATPEAAFDGAALKVLGYLVYGAASAVPSIDHGRVTAAVKGTSVGSELVLLATDQPMAQIASGLSSRGFRVDAAGLYRIGSAKRTERFEFVGLAPGLVVLSDSADEASAALTRTAADAPVAANLKRLDAVGGALRILYSRDNLPDRRAPCLKTVVGGQEFARSADTLALFLDRPGRRSSVLLGSPSQRDSILTRSYQPQDIRTAGRRVMMRIVTRPGALDTHNAATIASGNVEPRLIYRCSDASAPRGRRSKRRGSS